jgi:hypothetical protein
MGVDAVAQKRTLLRFQSNFVLPIARMVFLAGAAVAVIAVIGALAVALFLQVKLAAKPETVPIPVVGDTPLPSLELSTIDARMAPPTSVRFSVQGGMIDRRLDQLDVLGMFEASSQNELARFPDDFSILGGDSVDFFRRVPHPQNKGRSALVPTEALIDDLEQARAALAPGATNTQTYRLLVAARDIHGSYSPPATITFDLAYGQPKAEAPISEPAISAEKTMAPKAPPPAMTPLQQLAHDIALAIDPEQSAAYRRAHRRALEIPRQCGANGATPGFLAAYRRAFEHARSRLDAANVEPFYTGLCESWRQAVNKQTTARRKAEAVRNTAERRNRQIEQEFKLSQAGYWAGQKMSFYVAGGAFSLFLVIALSLAVLASENHSKVVRELAEAARSLEEIARRTEPNATDEMANGKSDA